MSIFGRILSFAVFTATGLLPVAAGPMSVREREHVISHLQMTGPWLLDEVSHLSEVQLEYRPGPAKWTIAEVVQHLVIAEPNYWKLLQAGMERHRRPSRRKAAMRMCSGMGLTELVTTRRLPSRTRWVKKCLYPMHSAATAGFTKP